MRRVWVIALIFVLSSFIQRENVEVKIDTDPKCLNKGKRYDFIVNVEGLRKGEYYVLIGTGMIISRGEGNWDMMAPETSKDNAAVLSVCKRKKGSEKTRLLKKFVFELCE
jgi:hypothetical protein